MPIFMLKELYTNAPKEQFMMSGIWSRSAVQGSMWMVISLLMGSAALAVDPVAFPASPRAKGACLAGSWSPGKGLSAIADSKELEKYLEETGEIKNVRQQLKRQSNCDYKEGVCKFTFFQSGKEKKGKRPDVQVLLNFYHGFSPASPDKIECRAVSARMMVKESDGKWYPRNSGEMFINDKLIPLTCGSKEANRKVAKEVAKRKGPVTFPFPEDFCVSGPAGAYCTTRIGVEGAEREEWLFFDVKADEAYPRNCTQASIKKTKSREDAPNLKTSAESVFYKEGGSSAAFQGAEGLGDEDGGDSAGTSSAQ